MKHHTNLRPTDKVTAATAGAALGYVAAWLLESLTVLVVTDPVQAAFAIIGAFVLGWLVPEKHPV